ALAPTIVTTRLRELNISANVLGHYKDLIQANKNTAFLRILGLSDDDSQCKALSPLTSVKGVVFKNSGVVTGDDLQRFLVSKRATLEELFFESPYNMKEMADLGVEPFDQLKFLRLDGDLKKNAGVFSLVHKSPNLRKLNVDTFKHSPAVWKDLGQYCPKLTSMVLGAEWLAEHDVARILAVECPALSTLVLKISIFSPVIKDSVLVSFAQDSSATVLSTIEILRTCPRLKRLAVQQKVSNKVPCHPSWFKEPWASSALEKIEFRGLLNVADEGNAEGGNAEE
ncbi:hypothetical protein BG004_003499, partial [Podila humilis]